MDAGIKVGIFLQILKLGATSGLNFRPSLNKTDFKAVAAVFPVPGFF